MFIEIQGIWISINWIKCIRIAENNNVEQGTFFQLIIDVGNISDYRFDFITRQEAQSKLDEIIDDSIFE